MVVKVLAAVLLIGIRTVYLEKAFIIINSYLLPFLEVGYAREWLIKQSSNR